MPAIDTVDLHDFEITGCYIRNNEILSFVGQKTADTEPYETRIFYYYPKDPPDDRWGFRHLGPAHRVLACGCRIPNDRWVFVNSEGGVYVSGGGDSSFEAPLPISEQTTITDVCCLSDGKAYAVSSMRNVFRRDGKSQWKDLSVPLHESEKSIIDSIGFHAIDSFSDTDIYACGSNCDMWQYNGQQWNRVALPVNSLVSDLACGQDGIVYVACWDGKIIKGRSEQWEVIQDKNIDQLDAIAWFDGTVYVTTWNRLYHLSGKKVEPVPYKDGYKQLFCGFLAAKHGYMLSAGPKEAHIFDGKTWAQIFNFN